MRGNSSNDHHSILSDEGSNFSQSCRDFNSENEYSNISDSDSFQSESDDEIGDYPENAFFDQVMFDQSQLTVRDIVILCSALSLRFHHSDESLLALMDLMKLCAGPRFTDLNLSKYKMAQCFSTQNKNVTYNYYCDKCSERIIYSVNSVERVKKKQVFCDKCSKNSCITALSPNYFISINLSSQILQLFSNDTIFNDVLKQVKDRNVATNENNNDRITDVYNSEIHKKIIQSNLYDDDLSEYMLTLNFNTDGATLTRSGKTGFWPLQLILNDLSRKVRFRFLLLGGILMVKNEPKSNLMNLYLSKFVERIHLLHTEGVIIKTNGKKILFKFCILGCAVDSKCRPVTQNRIQFNGYYGCSWCYQLGLYLSSCRGIRYVIGQEDELRTHESHQENGRLALDSENTIKGVKGYSALSDLPHFDMVWSFPYDYMHAML